MRLARGISIVVGLLLAGCANPSTTSEGVSLSPSETTFPSTASPSTTSDNPGPNQNATRRDFATTDCRGASAGYVMTTEQGPPPPRPEWEREGSPDANGAIRFFECQRISIFDFERGPVRIAYEWTDMATPPAQECFGDKASLILSLYRIYVDDRSIADNLTEKFGAPAVFATFDHVASPVGPLGQETWSMAVAGGAPTSVTFSSFAADPTDSEFTTRYVFAYKDGIAMMQETLHDYDDLGNPPLAYGTMQSPTVWHDYVGSEQYAGPASYFYENTWSGEFVFFEDAYCKVPA